MKRYIALNEVWFGVLHFNLASGLRDITGLMYILVSACSLKQSACFISKSLAPLCNSKPVSHYWSLDSYYLYLK